MKEVRVALAAFEADFANRFQAIAIDLNLLSAAARLAGVHGLRAYDAVQLCSALVARGAAPELGRFAAFDLELRAAAAREGFELIPTAL